MHFPENSRKLRSWPVPPNQNATKMNKINRPFPKTNQFWRWSGNIRMPNFQPFLPNPKLDLFHQVKTPPKWGKPYRPCRKSNQFSRWSGHISMSDFRGILSMRSSENTPQKRKIRQVDISLSSTCLQCVQITLDIILSVFIPHSHYSDVIMSVMASQITGVSIVYSTVCSGADQRTHLSSASLAFVRGIHRWPVNTPHKRQLPRKLYHFLTSSCVGLYNHLACKGRQTRI